MRTKAEALAEPHVWEKWSIAGKVRVVCFNPLSDMGIGEDCIWWRYDHESAPSHNCTIPSFRRWAARAEYLGNEGDK